MTINEFKDQIWGSSMSGKYKGIKYDVGSLNFPECLIGLDDGSDDLIWVRCENFELGETK